MHDSIQLRLRLIPRRRRRRPERLYVLARLITPRTGKSLLLASQRSRIRPRPKISLREISGTSGARRWLGRSDLARRRPPVGSLPNVSTCVPSRPSCGFSVASCQPMPWLAGRMPSLVSYLREITSAVSMRARSPEHETCPMKQAERYASEAPVTSSGRLRRLQLGTLKQSWKDGFTRHRRVSPAVLTQLGAEYEVRLRRPPDSLGDRAPTESGRRKSPPQSGRSSLGSLVRLFASPASRLPYRVGELGDCRQRRSAAWKGAPDPRHDACRAWSSGLPRNVRE